MARINIEDFWWTDHRRYALAEKLGSEFLADGVMARVWRLSQEFWRTGKRLVPLFEFEKIEFHQQILDVDLAIVRDKLVYVRGSRQWHDWVLQNTNNGRKGGKSLRKHAKRTRSEQGSEREASYSFSGSVSDSCSDSEKKDKTIARPEVSLREFEEIYREYPRKQGKLRGEKTFRAQIKTRADFDDLCLAVKNYSAYCKRNATEPRFVMHFSTFMNNWREWLDPETGTSKDFSGKETDWDYVFGRKKDEHDGISDPGEPPEDPIR